MSFSTTHLILLLLLLQSLCRIVALPAASEGEVVRCQSTFDTHDYQLRRPKPSKQKHHQPRPLRELRMVFHVVMNDDGTEGFVPLDSISANVDSANRVLSGAANTRDRGIDSRVRVFLAGVTYVNQSRWFYNCQDYAVAGEIKFATALSAATTVNVWTCHSPDRLGWVHYLPHELAQHSIWNGINLHYRALPPSQTDPSYAYFPEYADGDTLTHELGHILGLLHTFGNGVDGCTRGDGVEDTPPEKYAAVGKACRQSPPRKTCPGTPGVDPVWNLMDYTDDSCAEEFTPGQIEIMHDTLEDYRGNLIAPEPLRCVVATSGGSARPMSLCKSRCYSDRPAPNGDTSPTGWCYTDSVGNWGPCCCQPSCMVSKPTVPSPAVLTCSRKQSREELLKTNGQNCAVASVDRVELDRCGVSEFHRWSFNWDGTVVSLGTGWCLTAVDEMTVELRPCAVRNPTQRWNVLSNKPSTLYLQDNPTLCLDQTFTLKNCSTTIAKWQRVGSQACSSLRTKRRCEGSRVDLGCACRWYNRRCIAP